MIDVTNHNHVEETGTQAPEATGGKGEEPPKTKTRVRAKNPPRTPSGRGTRRKSEPRSHDPLERYLTKLLTPVAEAPCEHVPEAVDEEQPDETPALRRDDEEHWGEWPTPQEPVTADLQGPPGATEAPKEVKPLWQNTEESVPEAPPADSLARTAAEPSPPKSRPKPTIGPLTHRDKPGGGWQKLMITLIPVLAILMVFVLKYPLGTRSTAKAASASRGVTIPLVVPDIRIGWELPSPYEPTGRDPMRVTPPPAVAVQSAGTTVQPAEPPADLVVTGILHSEDRPAAIVNTQVVHEGQQISGATVEKIEKDGVQFERNGRRWKQAVNE